MLPVILGGICPRCHGSEPRQVARGPFCPDTGRVAALGFSGRRAREQPISAAARGDHRLFVGRRLVNN